MAIYPATPTILKNKGINSPGFLKTRQEVLALKEATVKLDERLRSYQNQCLNFMVNSKLKGLAIFDEQRLGKTPTVLSFLKLCCFSAIIIVPKSLLYNWYKEYKLWYNEDTLLIDKLDKQKRIEAYKNANKSGKSLIISYNTVSNDIDDLYKYANQDCIILDEAHRIRNLKKSRKYVPKEASAVLKLSRKCEYKIALSGTPSPNYADDIYGILAFLYPDIFTSYYNFVDYYFKKETIYKRNPYTGKVDTVEICKGKFQSGKKQELLEFLELISVQRKRKDVMEWLPRYNVKLERLQPTELQEEVHQSLINNMEYGEDIVCLSILELLTAQKQLTISPEVLGLDDIGSKFEYVLSYIDSHPEESIIVVSSLVRPLKMLQEKIKNAELELIIGDTSAQNRDRIKTKFQNKEIRLLLANLNVIKEGFTLDTADTIIFLDFSYVYTDNVQCMDRLVPVSADRVHDNQQQIILLALEGTVDDYIYQKVFIEKASSTTIVNDYEQFIKKEKN